MEGEDDRTRGKETGPGRFRRTFDDRMNYSREQLAAMRKTLQSGQIPACPECGGLLSVRPVERPEGVGYVRHRSWWLCSGCRRSAVLDTRQTGSGDPELPGTNP